jgi:hypothetical protein
MINWPPGSKKEPRLGVFERSPAAGADRSANFTVRGLTVEPD